MLYRILIRVTPFPSVFHFPSIVLCNQECRRLELLRDHITDSSALCQAYLSSGGPGIRQACIYRPGALRLAASCSSAPEGAGVRQSPGWGKSRPACGCRRRMGKDPTRRAALRRFGKATDCRLSPGADNQPHDHETNQMIENIDGRQLTETRFHDVVNRHRGHDKTDAG